MKKIGHAWVGLMALYRLNFLKSGFNDYYKKQVDKFMDFFDKHKDAFVQGAWFPDSVISDNLAGAHTYKLKFPESESEKSKAINIKDRTPSHLSCQSLIKDKARLNKKVYNQYKYTLPDRCEALSHSIRDMILIQKKEPKGSDIMFNDDQITLYFLMLSHYIADAHVPPHSDARDFYDPSSIHPDMEKHWDKEILKYYVYDNDREVFDYDVKGVPEVKEKKKDSFEDSFLNKALKILEQRKWNPTDKKLPGTGNVKIYDYLKAVCLVSYVMSTEFIPLSMSKSEYNKLEILKEKPYLDKLNELSPHVFADAIDSIALVWLVTWDKYNKLKEEIAKKKEEIQKSKNKKGK
ncbi:MAG: hypothetical protein OEW48_11870 [Phycisphaerae bacterium]|nr:hypothetical protein [Phycisphaerae bacterium]